MPKPTHHRPAADMDKVISRVVAGSAKLWTDFTNFLSAYIVISVRPDTVCYDITVDLLGSGESGIAELLHFYNSCDFYTLYIIVCVCNC